MSKAPKTPHVNSDMKNACVQKTCREQPPIFTAKSKRAIIYTQRPQIDSGNEIGNIRNDADGHQQGSCGISPEVPHGHTSAGATRGNAGATVTEPAHEVGPGRVVASVTDPDGNVLGLLQDR